jgi:hypothetical protein
MPSILLAREDAILLTLLERRELKIALELLCEMPEGMGEFELRGKGKLMLVLFVNRRGPSVREDSLSQWLYCSTECQRGVIYYYLVHCLLLKGEWEHEDISLEILRTLSFAFPYCSRFFYCSMSITESCSFWIVLYIA